MKIRTIITQDAEVDDQNSLRHFLLYANEVELQGIIQTSSVFHWKGKAGAVGPKMKYNEFVGREMPVAPYDQPFRWTGTDWMFREIDDYEVIYPNLIRHADGYPAPDYLRSITKVGNVGYSGDVSESTEGSELIRTRILDDDPRTLYIQVWGGTNTIARALMDIEAEYAGKENWPELHEAVSRKVFITACGEQDDTYRGYIAENWPDIRFVVTLQMQSYAYPWKLMPECESKDCLYGSYMKEHILIQDNPLAAHYCTWFDGKYYEGERDDEQYGTNHELACKMRNWGLKDAPLFKQYDFISEGDSPTFFWMFDWGLRTIENFEYGGVSGRYYQDGEEKNSKGERLNYWKVLKENFTGRDGSTAPQESMWRYVRDIQHDMAARVRWGITPSYENGEHAPKLKIREGLDHNAADLAGHLILHADTVNKDGGKNTVTWRIYEEASKGESFKKAVAVPSEDGLSCDISLPEMAAGDSIHIIVCAEADGPERLRHYAQVIIRG